MPRAIKTGDTVQAFLNAAILGEVVEITSTQNTAWTIGGTSSARTAVCVVRVFKTNQLIRVAKSELFIVDYS